MQWFWIPNGIMLLAFAASVFVQLNDPDPARWIAMWSAAAIACAIPARHLAARIVPAATGAIAVAWALTLRHAPARIPFGDMFQAIEMKSVAVEEAREFYGLCFIALWMAVLSVRAWRRR